MEDVVVMLDGPGDQPANPPRCELRAPRQIQHEVLAGGFASSLADSSGCLNGGPCGCYRSGGPREENEYLKQQLRNLKEERRADAKSFTDELASYGYGEKETTY
jgi:hypothetical protein